MARNSRYFDDQGVDEGLQVTILDAVPRNPAKPAANRPLKAALPWRLQLEERLAVFAANKGEAGGLATSSGKAGGINAADLVDIARGGAFERLKDPNIFLSVEIGPDRRALIWRIGKDANDVIVMSADELWLMKRPVDF